MNDFYEGEYIIYRNGEKYELGRITSLREDGAFVCYHEGETAAKTPYDHMHKLMNKHVIMNTSLGGGRFPKPDCEKGNWVISVEGSMFPLMCSRCGKRQNSQSRFCPECGAYMEDK